MQIIKIEFNPFSVNTYILYGENREAIIIDPGCYSTEEQKEFTDIIETNNLIPKKILLTHAHIDHIFGCAFVQEKYKIDLLMHKDGDIFFETAINYSQMFGIDKIDLPKSKLFIEHNSNIFLNEDLNFIALHTPGHADGSLCFYNSQNNLLFSGDVLFKESIGRTDLPTGDHETLINKIKKVLFTLPLNTTVYPGHGASTTIENEINYNPFL
jgi:glyoxylase-like metal-dependent hydrolase (beta-lactamase superfamily II)